jgi:hypothetical protein
MRTLCGAAQSFLPDMVTYSSPVTFLDAFRRQLPLAGDASANLGAPPPPLPPLMGAFTTANNHSADMGPDGCALRA